MIQQMVNEVYSKMMKGKGVMETQIQHSPVDYNAFAGYYCTSVEVSYTWIVDSGESCHMYHQKNLFTVLDEHNAHIIHFLDGNIKKVMCSWNIKFTNDLTLKNMFYVPDFQYNLLSISQLARQNGFEVFFNASYYCLQDLKSKEVRAWQVRDYTCWILHLSTQRYWIIYISVTL